MMKFLCVLIFLAPFGLYAQECQLKSSTDPFTHEKKITTGFVPYNKGSLKLSLSIDATPSLIDFFFWITSESRCFDDASYAEIVFDGEKSKMRLKGTGSMNCQGAFHFSFKNSATPVSQLNKLAAKPVNYINIYGANKTETLITLTGEQKQQLMSSVNCVLNQAKQLL